MSRTTIKHDCPGCKSFPECPCGDGNCPSTCSLAGRPTYTDPGLIQWPVHDHTWHDDGQGGLYAWLVVPGPDTYEQGPMRSNGGCCVDVWPTMNRPDAPVSPLGELWEEYDWRWNVDEGHVHALVSDQPQLLNWVQNQRDSREQSDVFYATIFLGATSCAYYNDAKGRQFEATYQHLTPAGKALYDGFKAAFHTEPLILTFLDT